MAWIVFQKKKWAWQAAQRGVGSRRKKGQSRNHLIDHIMVIYKLLVCMMKYVFAGKKGTRPGESEECLAPVRAAGPAATLGGFLKRAQRTLLDTPWQIIQVPISLIYHTFILTRYSVSAACIHVRVFHCTSCTRPASRACSNCGRWWVASCTRSSCESRACSM